MNRRLIGSILAYALLLIVALEVPLGLSLAHNTRSTALATLRNEGATLGIFVAGALANKDTFQASEMLKNFGLEENASVLVLESGVARLTTGAEAKVALEGAFSRSLLNDAEMGHATTHYGGTGNSAAVARFMYFAIPLAAHPSPTPAGPRFQNVLMVAEPIGPIESRVDHQWLELAIFGVVLLGLAIALGVTTSRSLVRPLATVEGAVAEFGRGDLRRRAATDRGPPEVRELARSFNEMAARLEELLVAQRAFVADASHQLRSPMTALRLRLENLEGSLPKRSQSELAQAVAETDRLSRVVDGLLALARAEGARTTRDAVDVASVLAGRVESWTPLADERGVRLSSPPPRDGDGPLRALAVPGALEQILDNFLANALDATPPGGAVTLRAVRRDDAVEIHVEDTGAGMSEVERERAFDRFWRKEGSHAPGTGLGLAIVAQLVRASGGRAWLDAGAVGLDAVVSLPAR